MDLELRVLVADPDTALRYALALLLKSKLGLRDIREAQDGESLNRALAESPPDVLLLDWCLPGRPTPAALLDLQHACSNLHLVILSVDLEHATDSQALGAVYIHKGSAAAQVVEQLRVLLEGKPRRANELSNDT